MTRHPIEKGTGRPILFIHGFGAGAFTWKFVIDDLSSQNRCIAIDLLGFGAQSGDADDLSIEAQARFVASCIESLGLREVIIVGHSFGGGIAILLASKSVQCSASVVGVALVDSVAYEQDMPLIVRAFRSPWIVGTMRHIPPKILAALGISRMFYDPSNLPPSIVEAYAENIRTNFSSFVRAANQINMDAASQYAFAIKRIRIPTLVMWGRDDAIVPLDIGRRLAREISGAHLKIIDKCGHVPQEERPDAFVQCINQFIESIE